MVFKSSFDLINNDIRPITQRFFTLREHKDTDKTHYFNGRFENIYPPKELFPELEPLLSNIKKLAEEILQPNKQLSMSYWFNEMAPENSTTLHTHDEDGELLSVVIYLTVPKGSGDIYFHPKNNPSFSLTPKAGDILFFRLTLAHEVLKNASNSIRLFLALNIGLKEDSVLEES